MNHRIMERVGDSLKISFIAARALLALSKAEQGSYIASDYDKKALHAASAFMQEVNSGRDVFRGDSLSASALHACTAYDLALRAVRSRAQSLLTAQSLEGFFTDIAKSLEDLVGSRPVKKNQLAQSKVFFSWLMKSTSDETRQALESQAGVEIPEWLSK